MTMRTQHQMLPALMESRPAKSDAVPPQQNRAAMFASATQRIGADPRYTGPVSIFDPRAAGYQDPLLVTASGVVSSKL